MFKEIFKLFWKCILLFSQIIESVFQGLQLEPLVANPCICFSEIYSCQGELERSARVCLSQLFWAAYSYSPIMLQVWSECTGVVVTQIQIFK